MQFIPQEDGSVLVQGAITLERIREKLQTCKALMVFETNEGVFVKIEDSNSSQDTLRLINLTYM